MSDIRGAVWNFPAMPAGNFTTSLRLPEGSDGVSLILNDRWFNPSDSVARHEGIYVLPLSRKELGINDNEWHEISVDWDTTARRPAATVKVDGRRRKITLPMLNPTIDGISYAHFIAEPVAGTDPASNPGIMVGSVRAVAAR